VILIDRVRFRLRALRRRHLEHEFDEEQRFHVEQLIEKEIARGTPPDEARRAALREFGDPLVVTEELRAARGLHFVDTLAQDIRYGARLLRRNPGFAAAAIITVALGMGATTAVFSVVYGVLLRPLPYPAPDRLVTLWTTSRQVDVPREAVGAANYRDWRAQARSFESLAIVRDLANFNLTGVGEPERLLGARITASLFSVLQVRPAHGRPFTEDEEQSGRSRVVILSDALWTRRFGRDPHIVGQPILLSGQPHVVVGIMPRGFVFPTREFALWIPLTVNPADYRTRSGLTFLAFGRLKADVTVAQAQAEMDVISERLAAQYPNSNTGVGALVTPMRGDLARDVRRPLVVLLGAVGCLLLIGCASLANLLIARAVARSGELVLRAALGAQRRRLVRQSLTELIPLLAIGGVLGILLAHWMLRLAVPWLPSAMPRVEEIAINVPVLLVAVALLLVTAVVTGVWPALQVARWDVAAALRESLRGRATTLHGAGFRDGLVVAQIAVAMLLSIAAALVTRSFVNLTRIDPGFRTDGIVTMHLAIPRAKYGGDPQIAAASRAILERVQQMPGVRMAGLVNRLPLAGGRSTGEIEIDRSASSPLHVDLRTASPDYFRVMGIPLVAGRLFTDADTADTTPVGIVDERLASTVWPGENPIGRRFRAQRDDAPWVTIVGVVGHIKHDGLTIDPRPQVYWNYQQWPMDRQVIVARGDGDADALARAIIAQVRAHDPDQPVYDVRAMSAVVARTLAEPWLMTAVLAAFAVVSLLLASIGVYGVVAYGVRQRAREFGIRMALGAARRDVLLLVVRRGLALVGWGFGIGVICAVVATQALEKLLYGVSGTDWVSFAVAAGVLGMTALVATLLPARRAIALDPTTVLSAD